MSYNEVGSFSNNSVTDEKCSFCQTDKNIRFRCSQCKRTWYCSPEHQKLDWKVHKSACRVTKTNSKDEMIDRETVSSMNSMHVGNSVRTKNNLSDYELTASPTGAKGPSAHVLQQADTLVHYLTQFGYCIIDGFLGEATAQKIHWNVKEIQESGVMTDGELVKKNETNEQVIRGDQIAWITGQEEQHECIKLFIAATDRLIRYSRRRIKDHIIEGRTPAMVACYPGDGTGYKIHIDNAIKDGRCVTCLYYLNKGWDSEQHGGALQLYPLRRATYVNIDPMFDRLVVFWSDRRTPHRVLPAYRKRFAITLWYFDELERNKVKEEYLNKMKKCFSSKSDITNPVLSSQTSSSSEKLLDQAPSTNSFQFTKPSATIKTIPSKDPD